MARKKKEEKRINESDIRRDPKTGAIIDAPLSTIIPEPETEIRRVAGGGEREFKVVPEEEAKAGALGREQEFIDPRTGRPSGITTPSGKTFLGLSPEEVALVKQQQEGVGGQQSSAIQNLIKQIGLTPEITPEQLAAELEKLNIPANLKSAMAGILAETAAGAAVGAGTGLTAGLIAAPLTGGLSVPVATSLGALTGGTAAAIRSVKNELKAEAKEDVAASNAEFVGARKAMKRVVSDVNQRYIDPSEGVRIFNLNVAKINKVERQLKELTRDNLRDYLSDGSTQYAKILEFNSAGGEGETLRLSLAGAIEKPDPSKVYIPDIEDLGELE